MTNPEVKKERYRVLVRSVYKNKAGHKEMLNIPESFHPRAGRDKDPERFCIETQYQRNYFKKI